MRPANSLTLSVIATGCTLTLAMTAAAAQVHSGVPVSPAERGYVLASARCSACHALTDVSASPNPGAPSFPQIGLNWPGRTLGYRIAFVTRNGHYAMPPRPLDTDDRAAIAAYIREAADRIERDRGN